MKSLLSQSLIVSVLLTLAAGELPAQLAGKLGTHVDTNVMVPMRDGTRLATDIYLPAEDGKVIEGRWPIVLTRTPYDKSGNASLGKFFTAHGYAFVAQDTRGRYASEGEWHWMTDDGPDGVDAARWIAEQRWSAGKIGMLGTSYVGGTQHALAMAGSPYLKTVIPVDAVCNMGYASMRNGGAFEMRFWNWIMLNAGRGSRAAQNAKAKMELETLAQERIDYLKLLPLRKGMTPLRLAPEYEEWLIEAMKHGRNDEYWRQNNIIDHADQYQDIPVYFVGGWYDSWASNTTASYRALKAQSRKSPSYLIMGPWIHGAQNASRHGQVDFGKEAAIADPLAWRLEWFDRWLKDKQDSVVGRVDPFATEVRIFVMGSGDGHKTDDGMLFHGGKWRNEQAWPLSRARAVNWYMQPGGGLADRLPPASSPRIDFMFDPSNPVPTIGGNISSGNDILLQGGWNQRGGPHVWNWTKPIPLSARNDVVVFQSAPLTKDMEVTGELKVQLWVASDCIDTDFTAKLVDVYPPSKDFPDGFDLNITDGIQRARYRDSLKEEKMLEPGKATQLTVKLYPTSNIFKRGHRIRIDISSSNFPRFDVNPNTGEPLNDHRRSRVATNSIYVDADHPSMIVLPIVDM